MTQGERVKAVRKFLGLTLEIFGAKIGLKKSGLSLIENGRNELTDSNAKAICREFGVLSLIHISEPTRPRLISYAVFCLKKKK